MWGFKPRHQMSLFCRFLYYTDHRHAGVSHLAAFSGRGTSWFEFGVLDGISPSGQKALTFARGFSFMVTAQVFTGIPGTVSRTPFYFNTIPRGRKSNRNTDSISSTKRDSCGLSDHETPVGCQSPDDGGSNCEDLGLDRKTGEALNLEHRECGTLFPAAVRNYGTASKRSPIGIYTTAHYSYDAMARCLCSQISPRGAHGGSSQKGKHPEVRLRTTPCNHHSYEWFGWFCGSSYTGHSHRVTK